MLNKFILYTAVVRGVTPLAYLPDAFRGAKFASRLLCALGRNLSVPWLKTVLSVLDPPPTAEILDWSPVSPWAKRYLVTLPACDREFLTANFEHFTRFRYQTFIGNPNDTLLASAEDLKAYASPVDFKFAHSGKLFVFHGTDDINVPVHQTKYWEEHVAGCNVEIYPHEGHWSLIGNRGDEMLRALS